MSMDYAKMIVAKNLKIISGRLGRLYKTVHDKTALNLSSVTPPTRLLNSLLNRLLNRLIRLRLSIKAVAYHIASRILASCQVSLSFASKVSSRNDWKVNETVLKPALSCEPTPSRSALSDVL